MTDRKTLEMYVNHNYRDELAEAADQANNQDKPTVLTEDGEPVVAIVPIEVLKFYDAVSHILRLWEEHNNSRP